MRRPSIIVLVLLSAAIVAGPVASAQDESTAAAEHPIVGAWIISDPGTDDPPDILTVGAGGTLTDAGPEGTGYGVWVPTGEASADATFLLGFSDPQAGFLGYSVFRTSVEVSADGQTLSGSYTIEPPPEMAEAFGIPVGQLGPGEVTGQRVVVEPMGETVAPIPSGEEVVPAE
jgi:hypothetical protein